MSSATEAVAGPPLVRTKLLPPARRGLVARPELVARLAAGDGRRLTVVRAPAGWGKTTLLALWADSEREERPFAWLALDAGDSDTARFWTYVLTALRGVAPGLPARALELLTAPGVDLREVALPVLVNDLAALPEPVVLVLDDLHVIESPAIDDALSFLVERLPPTIEIAVATREDPPFSLARLRARGELLEVDAPALRFSAGETRTLLNDTLALALHPEQVDALQRRTEGWAAGLYLAALSLRDRADVGAFIDAFAGDDRHVVDYLAGEVLAAVDARVRDFLLRTSVLDRLTASLCDAVTGDESGARMLAEIERSNLFLVPLDERREWYRYHHLFGDLLRRELELALPSAVPGLHRRAAAWHLQASDPDRAIRHTVAAGDHTAAVELVAEHWPAWLLERGEHGAIDAWLRALPAATVRADARLCLAAAYVGHSTGHLEGVESWLDAAERALGPDGDARLRGDIAATRASQLVQVGDNAAALAAAEDALRDGDPDSVWRPIPYGVRAHALRWIGDLDGALVTFEEGYLRESKARGQVLGVISSHGSIAHLHAEAGRWAAAEAHAARALELMRHALGEHWMMAETHTALALLRARAGDPAGALEAADRAIELARRGGVPGARATVLLAMAGLLHDGGRADEAAELAEEARGILDPCADPGAAVLDRLAEAAGRRRAPARPASGDELSERELSVLRLLGTELSQREIGDVLYVSLNTVKTHARHIFAKLGASGREEAIARARERGLL